MYVGVETLCNQWQPHQTHCSDFLCSENRFPHNRLSSLILRLLTSSLPPSTLQSYLYLSFQICPSFKQPPFSAAEMEQPPIVCLTKQHFSVPFWRERVRSSAQSRGFGFCSMLLCFYCFLPDLSFVVFWGISLSRNGQYQPCHTHYKHSNLLINLFWLVLDRLARDWRTLALSESSLTVFYCKSSDIIWPRTKTCFHIWTDDSL